MSVAAVPGLGTSPGGGGGGAVTGPVVNPGNGLGEGPCWGHSFVGPCWGHSFGPWARAHSFSVISHEKCDLGTFFV